MVKRYVDTATAIFRFLKAARNRAKEGMSKEQILDIARREFGEVSKLLRKQIDDIFKTKPKTEKKGDVVPIKKDEGIMSQYKTIDDEVTQAEKDAIFDNFLANADRTYANFVTRVLRDIQKAPKSERQQMIKAIKDRTGMFRYLDDAAAEKILKSVDETKDIKKVIDEKEGDDFIDFVRKQGDEEGANTIQKEVDRLNKAIEDADKRVAAKEALEKRTADIKKGDVEGEGIESLETSIKKIKETAEELKKSTLTPESMFENMIKSQRVMAEGYKTGNIRTAVREFMRSEEKAGRLKLNETDSFRIREYSPMNEDDPIDVFRRHYGEDALEAVDEIGDVFQQGESFSHYEQLLRENVDPKILTVKKVGAGEYDASVVAGEKIRKAKEQEAKNLKILEEFDPKDRTKNADGGLIDILKL